MARQRQRKTEAVLPGNKKSTAATEIRIYELTEKIVNSGWTRLDVLKYVQEEWGLSEVQAQRYWTAAVNYCRPKDPEKYREALINRNYDILESILKKALERNDLKEAINAVKAINQMLGVGGKSVEIKDKDSQGEDRKIIISFGD